MSDSETILARLMSVIEDRRAHPNTRSYTVTLLTAGVEKIGAKICEEAAEVVDAARKADTPEGRAHLVYEAADLIYHLFVMLGFHQIQLAEVEAELARRFGISGLDEKAARPPKENSGS
ncbi:MAG TPA: phosphoribosyl-ATP diphosphatase [Pirellulales bacterium]